MFVKGIGYCIASIWLLQLGATYAKPSSDGRIVGGQYTTIDNFKYLVQIWKGREFHCGGSLLTPELVVTAAHCVVGVFKDRLTVVGGATNLTKPDVSSNVEDIIMPTKKYDIRSKDNDMALVKLKNPLEGANIATIPLYTGELNAGMDVVLSGWGLTSENAFKSSYQLKTATVRITDRETCIKQYQNIDTVTKNMFCASQPGEDACTGDSGGPAVIDGKLAGIVSYGKGCARTGYSGVFTNIQEAQKNMKSWI